MILSPSQYPDVSSYDLLLAAERGQVGIDHRWLHALIDDPARSLPGIVRFATEDRGEEEPREDLSRDLIHLFRHLHPPEAVPYIIDVIEGVDDVSLELIETLRAIGEPAVAPLLEALARDPEHDTDIAFVAANLGRRDPRILAALTAMLDADPVEGAHCLAAYGDPDAIPALREKAAAVTESWQRDSLEQAIRRIETPEQDIAELDEFDVWQEYPDVSEPRFELLDSEEVLAFLDSPEPDYRAIAITELTQERDPDPKLYDRLLTMASGDPDAFVRGRCWQALGGAWDTPAIRKAIEARLADESAPIEERGGALVAVAENRAEDPQLRKLILDFYAKPEVRFRAVQAMVASLDQRWAPQIVENLHAEDPRLQMQAIQGIGFLELEDAADHLVDFFGDDELREEALTSYALAAEYAPTRRGVRQFLEKLELAAEGFDDEEELAVKAAINFKLHRNEYEPLFAEDGEMIPESRLDAKDKTGRNDPCPCGSGKKYKKCHGAAS